MMRNSDGEEVADHDIASLPKVHILRNAERQGLMRSRTRGADFAHSSVIVFLDTHVEVNVGWLEPLVAPIAKNYRAATIPTCDIIDDVTFAYNGGPDSVRGGTNWLLDFHWQAIPGFSSWTPEQRIQPIKTPIMVGGLFAISKKWWEESGKYDQGMEVGLLSLSKKREKEEMALCPYATWWRDRRTLSLDLNVFSLSDSSSIHSSESQ